MMHAVTSLPLGSLMHRLVSGLIAALLMLHVVAGCCWHHAHGGDTHQTWLSGTSSQAATCCSHAGHSHTPGTPDKGDRPNSPCDEPDCAFSGAPTQRHLDDWVDSGPAWLVNALPSDLSLVATIRAYQIDARDGRSIELPVRRHLLFSTLLI